MPRWTLVDYHVQDGATLYLVFDGDGSSDAYIPVAGQVYDYDETEEGTEISCEDESVMEIFVNFDTLEPREPIELVVSSQDSIAKVTAQIEEQEGIVIDT
eukprot:3222451-Heterocapsa_arctica.AAC.1